MWNVVGISQAREMGGVNVIPLTVSPLLEQRGLSALQKR